MVPWPNFFIVGGGRCGTTSLYEYLRCQPKVFMPARKEPQYFTINLDPNDKILQVNTPVRSKNEYLNLFKKAKDEVAIGEASVAYLADPGAPRLIHEAVPHARIIIIIRNPIERTWSAYLYNLQNGVENLSFSDVLKRDLKRLHLQQRSIIKSSFYSGAIQRYIDIFGSKQVKIIIFEEFVANPKKTVKDVLEFLGIFGEFSDFEAKAHNDSRVARSQLHKTIVRNSFIRRLAAKTLPNRYILVLSNALLFKKNIKLQILPEEREILRNIFLGEVLILQDMLGRQLSWTLEETPLVQNK